MSLTSLTAESVRAALAEFDVLGRSTCCWSGSDLVLAYVQGADEVGADETRWRMMSGCGTQTWWMWCLTTGEGSERPDTSSRRDARSRSQGTHGAARSDRAAL